MNFDATIVGNPYSRIEEIVITYTAPNTAVVKFTEQEHILLRDGTHRPLGGENVITFNVSPEDMGIEVPILLPNTGEPTGMLVTYGQVMLGILAIIKQKQ